MNDQETIAMDLPISIDFPKSFFEEETRNGFTITPKMKKVFAVELDLLFHLNMVCKELGIKYFFDSGSLLGAVRNGRFIPWDDDIDVVMLREDYDLFVRKAQNMFQHPYFLQNPYSEKGYARVHSQLRNSMTTAILASEYGKQTFNQGIFIDIFPLDGVNEKELEKQFLKRDILRKELSCLVVRRLDDSILKRSIRIILSKILVLKYADYRELYNKIEDIFRYNNDTEYVEKVIFRNCKADLYKIKRSWYSDVKYVDFEGMMVPVPIGYDHVLEAIYGKDYMTPKQGPSGHEVGGRMLIDPENPYTKYMGKEMSE